jgi:hypothetical protein
MCCFGKPFSRNRASTGPSSRERLHHLHHVHAQQAVITQMVAAPTGPWPIRRVIDKLPPYRILVHILDLRLQYVLRYYPYRPSLLLPHRQLCLSVGVPGKDSQFRGACSPRQPLRQFVSRVHLKIMKPSVQITRIPELNYQMIVIGHYYVGQYQSSILVPVELQILQDDIPCLGLKKQRLPFRYCPGDEERRCAGVYVLPLHVWSSTSVLCRSTASVSGKGFPETTEALSALIHP